MPPTWPTGFRISGRARQPAVGKSAGERLTGSHGKPLYFEGWFHVALANDARTAFGFVRDQRTAPAITFAARWISPHRQLQRRRRLDRGSRMRDSKIGNSGPLSPLSRSSSAEAPLSAGVTLPSDLSKSLQYLEDAQLERLYEAMAALGRQHRKQRLLT